MKLTPDDCKKFSEIAAKAWRLPTTSSGPDVRRRRRSNLTSRGLAQNQLWLTGSPAAANPWRQFTVGNLRGRGVYRKPLAGHVLLCRPTHKLAATHSQFGCHHINGPL
jgi:hypothetical protein